MIKIQRPETAPEVLTEKGADEADKLKSLFNDGVVKFDFDSDIYGHKSVKDKLKEIQREKCCFCESSFLHVAYGDVEHFRPKKAFKQKPGDKLTYPGYYWLAYDWTNLFLSCTICNRKYKRNLFPLLNPEERAKCHTPPHAEKNERPYYINPCRENPEEYITFRGVEATPRNNNERALKTISHFGLNRDELTGIRETRYETYKLLFEILESEDVSDEKKTRIKNVLRKITLPESEYSSMFRAALSNKFKY